ncbi:MAG: hypothetical protein ACXVJ2_16620, partial [Candidatus Angelobacter sp.]
NILCCERGPARRRFAVVAWSAYIQHQTSNHCQFERTRISACLNVAQEVFAFLMYGRLPGNYHLLLLGRKFAY